MADKGAHLVPLDGRSMLARALRSRRAEALLTQDQAGELIGVKGQTVRAWEREPEASTEVKRPQARHWPRLAEFLGLRDPDAIRDLLDGRPAESLMRTVAAVADANVEDGALRGLLDRLGSGDGPMSEAEIALANRLLDYLEIGPSND